MAKNKVITINTALNLAINECDEGKAMEAIFSLGKITSTDIKRTQIPELLKTLCLILACSNEESCEALRNNLNNFLRELYSHQTWHECPTVKINGEDCAF